MEYEPIKAHACYPALPETKPSADADISTGTPGTEPAAAHPSSGDTVPSAVTLTSGQPEPAEPAETPETPELTSHQRLLRNLKLVNQMQVWLKKRQACLGVKNIFYPVPDESEKQRTARIAKAKAICQHCVLLEPCREFAIQIREPYGVWGGMSEEDRIAAGIIPERSHGKKAAGNDQTQQAV